MPETSTLVQATKVSVNAATSGTKAFTDPLVAGNLIIVAVAVYDPAGGTSVIITAPTDTQRSLRFM